MDTLLRLWWPMRSRRALVRAIAGWMAIGIKRDHVDSGATAIGQRQYIARRYTAAGTPPCTGSTATGMKARALRAPSGTGTPAPPRAPTQVPAGTAVRTHPTAL